MLSQEFKEQVIEILNNPRIKTNEDKAALIFIAIEIEILKQKITESIAEHNRLNQELFPKK